MTAVQISHNLRPGEFARVTTHCNLPLLDTEKGQKEEDEEDLGHFIRNGTGYCLDPVHNESDTALLTAVCFSPPMHLKPGQVNETPDTLNMVILLPPLSIQIFQFTCLPLSPPLCEPPLLHTAPLLAFAAKFGYDQDRRFHTLSCSRTRTPGKLHARFIELFGAFMYRQFDGRPSDLLQVFCCI